MEILKLYEKEDVYLGKLLEPEVVWILIVHFIDLSAFCINCKHMDSDDLFISICYCVQQ